MPIHSSAMDLGIAFPARPDTFSPGAIEAVEAMRRAGHERRLDRIMESLVTKHGNPRIVPHSGRVPAGLVKIERIAGEHGWSVTRYESPTGHALQGRRGDLGFRATWQWGKTTGATWHEREPRWTLVDDGRAVKVDKVAKVGLKGYRTSGLERVHLQLLAAPWGIPLNVTTLEERLAAS